MNPDIDILQILRKSGEGCICEAWSSYECGCEAVWAENHLSEIADEIETLRKMGQMLAGYASTFTNEHPFDLYQDFYERAKNV